jgi:hypothetical protein
MPKTLVAVIFVILPAIASCAQAATVKLDCTYQHALEGNEKSTSAAPGHFSAQIQFTDDEVTKITVGKSSRCDPRLAFVTDSEIGFACGIDLAGQRISYTFTLNRFKGSLEQRFFFDGKLKAIKFGQCQPAN